MNYFISGGCKNGKSMFAQTIARDMAEAENVPLYYVATMIPHDDEDNERIQRHLRDRLGWGFITLEQGRDILRLLDTDIDKNGVFLMDSVTALLSNEMFDEKGRCNFKAEEKVSRELVEFAEKTGKSIFVSDYIYSDAGLFDVYTQGYRRSLAYVDRQLAQVCQQVVEVTYGHKYYYKGRG